MVRYNCIQGDSTTNGGIIVSASGTDFVIDGVPIALDGDAVFCSTCQTQGKIRCVPPLAESFYQGKRHALGGDLCICKCAPPPKLISTQIWLSHQFDSVSESSIAANPMQGRISHRQAESYSGAPVALFTSWFLVRDSSTGKPMPYHPYVAYIDGIRSTGRTDHDGYALISTTGAKTVSLHASFASPKRHLKWQEEA